MDHVYEAESLINDTINTKSDSKASVAAQLAIANALLAIVQELRKINDENELQRVRRVFNKP